jgi:hypothetical protein
VLNQSYEWDSINNLSKRTDFNGHEALGTYTGDVLETFAYDSINRLTQYKVSAPQMTGQTRTVMLEYDCSHFDAFFRR